MDVGDSDGELEGGTPILGSPTHQPSPPPGDDTYLDIFRDISLMASDHPEKLARPHHKLTTL